MWKLSCTSYAVYNFSCIRVYVRPDDGPQLQPKHAAVNKLVKLVICAADGIHMVVINCHNFISRLEVFTARYDLCNYDYILLLPSQLAWMSLVLSLVDCVWNVMARAQKSNFVFRWNGRVHLNRRWRQFNRLLAAEVCASAVVMLDTPCSEIVWRVLATHSIRQFPFHSPSRASPCAITFQLDSTTD